MLDSSTVDTFAASFRHLRLKSSSLDCNKLNPEGLLQVVVSTPGGLGSPSSVTVPSRFALSGRVTV